MALLPLTHSQKQQPTTMKYSDMTHDLSNIPHKTQYIQLRKDLQAFLTEEKLTVPHISAGKFLCMAYHMTASYQY
jgi:hypothetical protein